MGVFDGQCFHMRSFPIQYRFAAARMGIGSRLEESGTTNGVHWEQTMGRIVLTFPLSGPNAELDEDDFKVEISSWHMKVSVAGKTINELSNELYDDINFDLSWWKVDNDSSSTSSKSMFIYLTKVTSRGWGGPWYTGTLNPHKKSVFSWHARVVDNETAKKLKAHSESLRNMDPGEPEDWNHDIATTFTSEQMCTGIEYFENESLVKVVIHLDEQTLDSATSRVPLDEIFSADITAELLTVSLRSDGFGICMGQLTGFVVPELTTWRVRHIRRLNLPEEASIKNPSYYNPALCIRMTKSSNSRGLWGSIFRMDEQGQLQLQCTPFSVPRERIQWSERQNRAVLLAPGGQWVNSAKAARAQEVCTKVECNQDLLLNRVHILIHLEPGLDERCENLKIDFATLFTLKVAEKFIQINFLADVEYPLCLGGLGGRCVPDSSSWEIFLDGGTEEENGLTHPVLKLSLSKAEGCRGRWEEPFTRWQPWQVSQHMQEMVQAENKPLDDLDAEDEDSLEG